tara:strand:- start:1973 stop:3346 length:1374 start_codon:yes stop_codon:yes gene_type:complete
MSFRNKVLDALNVTKQSINLPVETKFHVTGNDAAKTVTAGNPYALSKRVLEKDIGNGHKRTMDVVGFQVGTAMHENSIAVKHADGSAFCTAVERPYPKCSYNVVTAQQGDGTGAAGSANAPAFTTYYDTGFHALQGMYESANVKLQSMRKSAIPHKDQSGTHDADGGNTVEDHMHTSWPSTLAEQLKLLNEQPYADALYYHDMKLRFMITGVDNPDNYGLAKASNHRGLVRMVVLRPLSRRARLRHEGSSNKPIINHGYMGNWDTDVFFSKKRMLGGPIASGYEESHPYGDVVTTYGLPSAVGSKGFRRNEDEVLCQDSTDVHYGHVIPYSTMATEHDLSPFQVMTSPINRKDYAVIVDKSFHLDIQHHGVGSQRVENVNIPFRMKARFAGRKAGAQVAPSDSTGDGAMDVVFSDANLTDVTDDEPLNLASKPVIMFMSMDQKLSIEVEGYTSISEC